MILNNKSCGEAAGLAGPDAGAALLEEGWVRGRDTRGGPSTNCIAHIDADAFFASVITRSDPSLLGKPLLALGMGGSCVIAASYEAKAKGVKTGMPLKEARQLAPGAIERAADFHETAIASTQIEEILREHCPIIEQMSIDEWYLDLQSVIGGAPSNSEQWAKDVQATVLRKTALSVSVGVGPSKLLAKMAGEYRKPAGVTVLDEHFTIPEFLRDRPAAAIPGIGRRTEPKVLAHGWKTAWDIATADSVILQGIMGTPGPELQRELLGERVSMVAADNRPPQSVSRCRSFRSTTDQALIFAHALKHLEYTVLKMRRHQLSASIICLWVRDNDYRHHGQCMRLAQPADTYDDMLPVLKQCFAIACQPGKRYGQVGISLSGLIEAKEKQYSLFADPREAERSRQLQQAMDNLHTRFGRNAITRGAALSVKTGTHVSLEFPVV